MSVVSKTVLSIDSPVLQAVLARRSSEWGSLRLTPQKTHELERVLQDILPDDLLQDVKASGGMDIEDGRCVKRSRGPRLGTDEGAQGGEPLSQEPLLKRLLLLLAMLLRRSDPSDEGDASAKGPRCAGHAGGPQAAPGKLPPALPGLQLGTEGGMQSFKDQLNAAMDGQEIRDPQRRTRILAFAMMQGAGDGHRDASKDGTTSAVGPLGVNEAVLRLAGHRGSAQALADQAASLSLGEAAAVLDKAMGKHGLDATAKAVCGGQTTLNDGKSFGWADFKRSLEATCRALGADPALATDDRRVWTRHIDTPRPHEAPRPPQIPAQGPDHPAGPARHHGPVNVHVDVGVEDHGHHGHHEEHGPLHHPHEAPARPAGGGEVFCPTGRHGVEEGMQAYKTKLMGLMDQLGIHDPQRREHLLAFAMMEGAKEKQLDRSKDGSISANGPININESVLRLAGQAGSSTELAARLPGMELKEGLASLNQAIDKAGLEMVLRAQRGGQTTLEDGKSYDFAAFKNNFMYTAQELAKWRGADPSDRQNLLTNDQRLWTETQHQ